VSQSFLLEFYVPKATPRPEVSAKLVGILEGHGFRMLLDQDHAPFLGEQRKAVKHLLQEGLSPAAVIEALLAAEGGLVSFDGPFHLALDLFPLGAPGNRNRARQLGESEKGEVALGSVRLFWQYLDPEENTPRLAATVELAHTLYPILHPVFAMGYIDEVWNPALYNLIPTEANVRQHGPRDFFRINIWGPAIIEKIPWRNLAEVPHVATRRYDDGGVGAWLTPVHYAEEQGLCNHPVEAEIVLGWHGEADLRIFRALMRFDEAPGQRHADLHLRLMGWDAQSLKEGRIVVAPNAEEMRKVAFAEIGLPESALPAYKEEGIWRKFAIRFARDVARGELPMDAEERRAFQVFLETYG